MFRSASGVPPAGWWLLAAWVFVCWFRVSGLAMAAFLFLLHVEPRDHDQGVPTRASAEITGY